MIPGIPEMIPEKYQYKSKEDTVIDNNDTKLNTIEDTTDYKWWYQDEYHWRWWCQERWIPLKIPQLTNYDNKMNTIEDTTDYEWWYQDE